MTTTESEIKVASGIAKRIETIKIDTVGTEITTDHEIVGTETVETIDIVKKTSIGADQGAGVLIEDEDIETNHEAHRGKTTVEDQDLRVDVMIKRNRRIEALDSIHLRKKTKFQR